VVSSVHQSICDAFKAPVGVNVSGASGLVCQTATGSSSPAIFTGLDTTGKKNFASFIDFVTPDRTRFFRRVYVGIRLKTYFFSKTIKADCDPPAKRDSDEGDCEGLYNIFPGTIDLTTGKDEAVTAGHLSSWLFRLEANYPFPFQPGIHLFASMYTAINPSKPSMPFNSYTINTPMNGAATDAMTFRFPLQPLNRDYFRVGIGLDIVQLLKKSGNGQPSAPAPNAQQSKITPGGQ
jgi:hypothetical protein